MMFSREKDRSSPLFQREVTTKWWYVYPALVKVPKLAELNLL